MLIKNGANVNEQNSLGNTPIIEAIKSENEQLVKLLLDVKSIDLEIVNNENQSAEEVAFNIWKANDHQDNGIYNMIMVAENKKFGDLK